MSWFLDGNRQLDRSHLYAELRRYFDNRADIYEVSNSGAWYVEIARVHKQCGEPSAELLAVIELDAIRQKCGVRRVEEDDGDPSVAKVIRNFLHGPK